jgi:hypothetical protein
MPGILAAMGSSASLWMPDVLPAAVLLVLAGVLAFMKRS